MPDFLSGYLPGVQAASRAYGPQIAERQALGRAHAERQAQQRAADEKMQKALGLLPAFQQGDPAAQIQLAAMGLAPGLQPPGVAEEQKSREEESRRRFEESLGLQREAGERAETRHEQLQKQFEEQIGFRKEEAEKTRAERAEAEETRALETHRARLRDIQARTKAETRQYETAKQEWQDLRPDISPEELEERARKGKPGRAAYVLFGEEAREKRLEAKRAEQQKQYERQAEAIVDEFMPEADLGPEPTEEWEPTEEEFVRGEKAYKRSEALRVQRLREKGKEAEEAGLGESPVSTAGSRILAWLTPGYTEEDVERERWERMEEQIGIMERGKKAARRPFDRGKWVEGQRQDRATARVDYLKKKEQESQRREDLRQQVLEQLASGTAKPHHIRKMMKTQQSLKKAQEAARKGDKEAQKALKAKGYTW